MKNLSSDEKSIANKFFEAFYHKSKPETSERLVDELVSEDFVDHASLPGLPPNKEGFKLGVKSVVAAFHQEYTVNHLFRDGDFFTGIWTAKVTHHGNFLGMPATNKSFEVEGITVYEIKDGKIRQHWEKFDLLKIINTISPK